MGRKKTEEQEPINDVETEIAKLTRIKEKIEKQIRMLKRTDIDYGIFKIKMIQSGREKETYEVYLKAVVDGTAREIPILKAPSVAGIDNQLLSVMDMITNLRKIIWEKWIQK